ncbi:hypothetical protein RclHR1_06000001, partial [Rhizophagus clarus]
YSLWTCNSQNGMDLLVQLLKVMNRPFSTAPEGNEQTFWHGFWRNRPFGMAPEERTFNIVSKGTNLLAQLLEILDCNLELKMMGMTLKQEKQDIIFFIYKNVY